MRAIKRSGLQISGTRGFLRALAKKRRLRRRPAAAWRAGWSALLHRRPPRGRWLLRVIASLRWVLGRSDRPPVFAPPSLRRSRWVQRLLRRTVRPVTVRDRPWRGVVLRARERGGGPATARRLAARHLLPVGRDGVAAAPSVTRVRPASRRSPPTPPPPRRSARGRVLSLRREPRPVRVLRAARPVGPLSVAARPRGHGSPARGLPPAERPARPRRRGDRRRVARRMTTIEERALLRAVLLRPEGRGSLRTAAPRRLARRRPSADPVSRLRGTVPPMVATRAVTHLQPRPSVAVPAAAKAPADRLVQAGGPALADRLVVARAAGPGTASPSTLFEEKRVRRVVQEEVRRTLTAAPASRLSREEYGRLADRVYSTLTRRLLVERERRGPAV